MRNIFLYLHQLPQHLIALLLRLIYKGYDSKYKDVVVRRSVYLKGGISLGKYIIVNQWFKEVDIKHEYGHSVQSRYLGWLYLLVVGLPSLLWAMFYRGKNYYSFFTEKWADKLGGVKR